MTAIIERPVTNFDADIEDDFDPTAEADVDLNFDTSLDCSDLGYHRDAYVVNEDSYTLHYECDSCGDSFKENK